MLNSPGTTRTTKSEPGERCDPNLWQFTVGTLWRWLIAEKQEFATRTETYFVPGALHDSVLVVVAENPVSAGCIMFPGPSTRRVCPASAWLNHYEIKGGSRTQLSNPSASFHPVELTIGTQLMMRCSSLLSFGKVSRNNSKLNNSGTSLASRRNILCPKTLPKKRLGMRFS